MQYRIDMRLVAMSAMAASLLLGGCSGGGGGSDNTVNGVVFKVNTPAEIAQVSADDYNANANGLITAATLKRWKDDWVNQRPAGITGKLIILQVTAGTTAGTEYIKPNGSNVFTYLSPSSEWTQTRSNGVIESVSMVPDGAAMDALLKKYNIDPRNDMIVAAMGQGTTGNAMGQGRIWYALRYWGVDKKNLAILNGGNQWINANGMTTDDFQADASAAPNSGTASVKSLAVDNTQLQATLEDMLKVLPSSDANVLNDGVFIWDARSTLQYSAGLDDGKGAPVADHMTTFQNGGSRQGHPNGALQLDFSNLLVASEGYRYKNKADLQAYLDGNVSGAGFISGNLQPVGAGNAYQNGDTIYTYCETTFRAMITGVASAVVLGKPTRFYDGAMYEWNSLTYTTDKNGDYILPANSPWRTDVVSFYRPANSNTTVNTRTITNAYAGSANAIVNADKGYKTGETVVSGGGGGLPGNPCGG